jgi:hypothetical protein
MKTLMRAGLTLVATLCFAQGTIAAESSAATGTEEFGLTPKQLVEAVEKVEALISTCMREQGFQYVPVDYNTVRKGMDADKNMPGVSEKDFIRKFGFGVSTTYTGEPPQLAAGYSPAKVGLGKQNVTIFKGLGAADQLAYNRALFGENTGATFAVALETENFAFTGGCTRKAVGHVFKPDQLEATYYNPKDAMINKDPRMRAALRQYGVEMRKAGFSYNHPDEVEHDVRRRLASLTNGGNILLEKMTPAQQGALKELQDYERRVATKNFQLQEDVIDPVAEKIERELFARKSQ